MTHGHLKQTVWLFKPLRRTCRSSDGSRRVACRGPLRRRLLEGWSGDSILWGWCPFFFSRFPSYWTVNCLGLDHFSGKNNVWELVLAIPLDRKWVVQRSFQESAVSPSARSLEKYRIPEHCPCGNMRSHIPEFNHISVVSACLHWANVRNINIPA